VTAITRAAGIASMAIADVDAALWDLKARLLNVPLVRLPGPVREAVPVYGSGGFTSHSVEQLQHQLAGWVSRGITRVKMKIGRQPSDDDVRVRKAREAIGPDAELFVDANGASGRKEARAHSEAFVDAGVTWFEEPVSSDDLEGLRLLRGRAPAGMDITAGEYGYDQYYTASALHLHPCCALGRVRHLEHFYDHERIERMLFDDAPEPVDGMLRPDISRPGLGLALKRGDASRYAA
jgi:L-alanine-DL-glutamate epimerase-like enolase superfamily enzyme